MIRIRKTTTRGVTKIGWLTSYHSFSFNRYYDREYVHFGPLRVLNDDLVMPGTGFDTHPHENMEIVTYVLEGALEHSDNTGTQGVIRPSEVQRMSAGTGIMHSEFNHSKTEPVHFLQIWFLPDQEDLSPGYEQTSYTTEQRTNILLQIASGKKDAGGVFIHQDATISVSLLETGHTLKYPVSGGRGVYLYLIEGSITVNQMKLTTGDAAIVDTMEELAIAADIDSEIALFDVPL
jgi:redox-sensitive bicupin YhaK (pirin superfamily)